MNNAVEDDRITQLIDWCERTIRAGSQWEGEFEDIIDICRELRLLRALAEAGAERPAKSEPSLGAFTFGGGGAYAADDD